MRIGSFRFETDMVIAAVIPARNREICTGNRVFSWGTGLGSRCAREGEMQNSLEKTPNSADSAPSGETPPRPVETVISKRDWRIFVRTEVPSVQFPSTVKGGQL